MDTLGNRAAGQGGLRREQRTEDVAVGGGGPSERSARGITSCVTPEAPPSPGRVCKSFPNPLPASFSRAAETPNTDFLEPIFLMTCGLKIRISPFYRMSYPGASFHPLLRILAFSHLVNHFKAKVEVSLNILFKNPKKARKANKSVET